MENFKKLSFLKQWKLDIKDLAVYKKNLREYEYKKGVPLKHIKLRNTIHPILVKLISLDRKANKYKLEVIQDDRIKTPAQKIYACGHIGGTDIERIYEAIKDPAYLFLGDPGVIYRNATGLILFFNGVICTETRDRNDRKIAKARSIELLKNGGHLMIYPEGAWNVTPNLPIMKLFKGAVDMAIETGAEIIPVAIEQYGDQFYAAIGKNINYEGYTKDDVDELNKELRDVLCTLKWHIFERSGKGDRNQFTEEFKQNYAQKIVDSYSGGDLTLQDVEDGRFHDKTIAEPEEVYAPVRKLTPNKNNAFLFNKNLKG